MKIVADLHVHSRFAMACSPAINPLSMQITAVEKGINVLGTGDILHRAWRNEMLKHLAFDADSGMYKIDAKSSVWFVPSAEVSTIFEGSDKSIKKIHNCILFSSIEAASNAAERLSKYGSLSGDGRPQLQMSAAELVEEVLATDKDAFVFPAHLWTPYFGALGALSGFDSIKEAYGDQEKNIHAYESGLSSDPKMNWRISALDKYALISNSDMHSLPNMGREANVFDLEKPTYVGMINAIKAKDVRRFNETIEYYPEEGKYHYDGHRDCHYSVDPEQGAETNCKVCGKRLVVGVLHRINDLADRPAGYRPKNAIPYTHAVPLLEVIAYAMKKDRYSPIVKKEYSELISAFGNELDILVSVADDKIRQVAGEDIAECIDNVRNERISIKPGYAGVYGEIDLLKSRAEHKEPYAVKQKSMSDFLSG